MYGSHDYINLQCILSVQCSMHRLTGRRWGLNTTNGSIKPSAEVCVCVSKTNIKLDSLLPQKLEETSTDGFVLNMLGELDLCRHMCSPIH